MNGSSGRVIGPKLPDSLGSHLCVDVKWTLELIVRQITDTLLIVLLTMADVPHATRTSSFTILSSQNSPVEALKTSKANHLLSVTFTSSNRKD
jgi:hypothetical protein